MLVFKQLLTIFKACCSIDTLVSKLSTLLTNIRLGRKLLPNKNTLAYSDRQAMKFKQVCRGAVLSDELANVRHGKCLTMTNTLAYSDRQRKKFYEVYRWTVLSDKLANVRQGMCLTTPNTLAYSDRQRKKFVKFIDGQY